MNILIIDLETTGFSLAKDEIAEIGMVRLNLLTGQKSKLFDNIIKPKLSTEKLKESWIVKNGYISIDEFQNTHTLEDYRDWVQYIIDSFPAGATAFNNTFDFGFMEANGFKFPKKLDDPMKLSTPICKIPTRNGYKGYKWPNVDEAYKFFFPDSEYKELHRGADDAFHEADIVKALYDLNVFEI